MTLEERVERILAFSDAVNAAWDKVEQTKSPVTKHAQLQMLSELNTMLYREQDRLINQKKKIAINEIYDARNPMETTEGEYMP